MGTFSDRISRLSATNGNPLWRIVVGVVLISTCITAIAAPIADLRSDWSNTSNPNPGLFGTWSYTENGNPLPPIAQWAGDNNVSGWGPPGNIGGDFLPFFFKAPTNYGDAEPGDIIVHSTDGANGAAHGPAIFIWTSSMNGTVTVSGSVWPTRLIDRLNEFQLTHFHTGGPTVLASGAILENGSISRCNPIRFRIPGVVISTGDVLTLRIEKLSMFGDFAGVNLALSTDNCPTTPGDLNNDGKRDGRDITHFVHCLVDNASPCVECYCGDMNNSGAVDLGDVLGFVAALL
ncbi:MAG: hypothetical protein HZA51_08545 [Planctomycetes bacterium]|nr:hypothetical protein [Planctomycetota bacterium]